MACASGSIEKFRFSKGTFKLSKEYDTDGPTVKIRHVTNPQNFYLLLLQNTGRYTEIFDELNRVYKQNEDDGTIDPLPGGVEVGDHCVFKSFSFYFLRGEVIAVRRKEVDIVDVDAGELHEGIPLDSLFPVLNNSLFRQTPMLAPRCKLDCIEPPGYSSWKPATIERFLDMYGNRNLRVQFYSEEGDLYVVNLFTKNYDVSDHMIAAGMASRTRYDEPESQLPSLHLSAEVGKEVNVAVCYVECPASFYVQLEKNEDLIAKISREMNREYSSSASSYPFNGRIIKGQLCAVQYSFDQGWCRAEILSRVSPSKVEVKYIDYGNKEAVLIKNLRRLKPEFQRHAPQAVECNLRGVRTLPVLSDRFVKLAEGQRMIIKIHCIDFENLILSVTLFQNVGHLRYNINDYLAGKAEGPPEIDRPRHGVAPCPYPDNEFELGSDDEEVQGPSCRDIRPSPRRQRGCFGRERGDFGRERGDFGRERGDFGRGYQCFRKK